MLETRNLSFQYSQSSQFHFPDLTLEKGGQLLIHGTSGSGKTTLLHLLCGILKAAAGNVFINGRDIQKPGFRQADSYRGRNIGMIFQRNMFIDSITMTDNLLIAQALPGLNVNRERVSSLMEELDILRLGSKYPPSLSQGELQRFSVARALVNSPVLLLADEPTSSLDDENCQRFIHLLKETSANHSTALVIATHDARLKSEIVTTQEL